MSKIICEHQSCTGCSACRDACPKQCISMQTDTLDATYPVIDETTCIGCGVCEKTCPNNRTIEFRHPQKVLAAWSKDDEVRHTSASGGIACELYRHWVKNGGVATGVVYDRDEGCHFILIEKEEDIKLTQNSKYTFSDTSGIYKTVKDKLNSGIPVLFCGTPCQVAGLYGYLKNDYEKLTTIDLICHGMAPIEYINQHIRAIEFKKKEKTQTISFRDPLYDTYTYAFTLRNKEDKEFYKKNVLSFDNYQLAFHKCLCYRENCYQCKYARQERISDLTIGDFSGLGRIKVFSYDKRNTSCILQNTSKGHALLNKVANVLFLSERPSEEAFLFEHQLQSPSLKHPNRHRFEKIYRKNKDFENAANRTLYLDKLDVIQTLLKKRVVNLLITLQMKK